MTRWNADDRPQSRDDALRYYYDGARTEHKPYVSDDDFGGDPKNDFSKKFAGKHYTSFGELVDAENREEQRL